MPEEYGCAKEPDGLMKWAAWDRDGSPASGSGRVWRRRLMFRVAQQRIFPVRSGAMRRLVFISSWMALIPPVVEPRCGRADRCLYRYRRHRHRIGPGVRRGDGRAPVLTIHRRRSLPRSRTKRTMPRRRRGEEVESAQGPGLRPDVLSGSVRHERRRYQGSFQLSSAVSAHRLQGEPHADARRHEGGEIPEG